MQYMGVFISEYSFPLGINVWKRPMKTGQFSAGKAVEKLFYIAKGSL